MRTQSKAFLRSEPLVRIAKRDDMPGKKAWLIRGLAILLALCTGGLIVLALGHNPFAVYRDMLGGALGSKTGLRETVKLAVPLLGAALAIAPAFKMKFWNIGAEGQILAGGIAATYFAIFWAGRMAHLPLLILMFLAAAVAGGLWGFLPAVFKAKWGTNETLFTLMLNYIALGIEQYLQNGPWKDRSGTGFPIIAQFDKNAWLPKVLGVHIGWIIVLLFVVLMFLYLKYTKQGYEISVVGESQRTAAYAGMNVPKIIIRTMCISGAIAGVVGFLTVSGADHTLHINTAGGVGFTAITVAWLAKLNPIIMVFIAFFLAILSKGAGSINSTLGIPTAVAEVLTGVILFFMLGCEFFISYKLIFRSRKGAAVNG